MLYGRNYVSEIKMDIRLNENIKDFQIRNLQECVVFQEAINKFINLIDEKETVKKTIIFKHVKSFFESASHDILREKSTLEALTELIYKENKRDKEKSIPTAWYSIRNYESNEFIEKNFFEKVEKILGIRKEVNNNDVEYLIQYNKILFMLFVLERIVFRNSFTMNTFTEFQNGELYIGDNEINKKKLQIINLIKEELICGCRPEIIERINKLGTSKGKVISLIQNVPFMSFYKQEINGLFDNWKEYLEENITLSYIDEKHCKKEGLNLYELLYKRIIIMELYAQNNLILNEYSKILEKLNFGNKDVLVTNSHLLDVSFQLNVSLKNDWIREFLYSNAWVGRYIFDVDYDYSKYNAEKYNAHYYEKLLTYVKKYLDIIAIFDSKRREDFQRDNKMGISLGLDDFIIICREILSEKGYYIGLSKEKEALKQYDENDPRRTGVYYYRRYNRGWYVLHDELLENQYDYEDFKIENVEDYFDTIHDLFNKQDSSLTSEEREILNCKNYKEFLKFKDSYNRKKYMSAICEDSDVLDHFIKRIHELYEIILKGNNVYEMESKLYSMMKKDLNNESGFTLWF